MSNDFTEIVTNKLFTKDLVESNKKRNLKLFRKKRISLDERRVTATDKGCRMDRENPFLRLETRHTWWDTVTPFTLVQIRTTSVGGRGLSQLFDKVSLSRQKRSPDKES